MKPVKIILILLFGLSLFISCNKEDEPKTGIISVFVVDNDSVKTPVADVEITIMQKGIIKKTDANGFCSFEVAPGDYFVDANVCCAGPGFIQYHKPVTVVEGETTQVILLACLMCV